MGVDLGAAEPRVPDILMQGGYSSPSVQAFLGLVANGCVQSGPRPSGYIVTSAAAGVPVRERPAQLGAESQERARRVASPEGQARRKRAQSCADGVTFIPFPESHSILPTPEGSRTHHAGSTTTNISV